MHVIGHARDFGLSCGIGHAPISDISQLAFLRAPTALDRYDLRYGLWLPTFGDRVPWHPLLSFTDQGLATLLVSYWAITSLLYTGREGCLS